MDVRPSRVPQKGLSAPAALALVVVVVASVAGFAFLTKTPVAPAPASSPPAALATPSGTQRGSPAPSYRTAYATPRPCVTPRIAALATPITRHPRPLAPTGFEVMTPWTGAEGNLVADAKAGFWAAGAGRLVRLDAKGAITASWTVADDPVFAAWGIVPAREGGVWLWGGSTIAWFDGERFRDWITAPSQGPGASWVSDVAEAPDGSLWAGVNADPSVPEDPPPANQGALHHWDGARWTDACRPRPSSDVAHLAVDGRGGVWVAPGTATSDVLLFDGTTWSTPPSDPDWIKTRALPNAWSAGLAAAADGSLWDATGGLGHFDGTTWTSARTDAVDLSGTVSLGAAPGGSAWLATGSARLPGDTGPRMGIAVAHFDGRTWTVYDEADGLPAPGATNWSTVTAVAASEETVIAATRDGFYRLAGDRWVRVGRSPAAGPAWAQRLLAVSAREAWAAADDGLWHLHDGVWTKVQVAGWKPPMRTFDVARAPDGTLAVAADLGTAVLRDGRWTVLAEEAARGITIADDGTIWVAEQGSESPTTTVVSFRFDGRTWMRSALPALDGGGWTAQLVLAPEGPPWLFSLNWGKSTLIRFDGTSWVTVPAPTAYAPGQILGVALAPNGDPWALLGHYTTDWAVARLDGTTWTLHRASDGLPQPGRPMDGAAIAIAPDGSLWVATDSGLAHFDGRRWSMRSAGHTLYNVSFAPDGALWAVGPSGVQRLPADLLAEPDPAAR